MMFTQNPEAQAISRLQVEGRELDITENQALLLCRLIQGFTQCIGDFVSRCVEADVVDAHTLMSGTNQLMKVCDKPGMYDQFKVLSACGKSLRNNADYKACSNTGKNKLEYLQTIRDADAAKAILRTGRVLKDVCCVMKEMKTCMAPQIATCTPQAVTLHEQTMTAVNNAYGCAQRTAAGC